MSYQLSTKFYQEEIDCFTSSKVLNRRSSVTEQWKGDKLYKCNNGDLIYNVTSLDNPNLNIKTTSYRHYFL